MADIKKILCVAVMSLICWLMMLPTGAEAFCVNNKSDFPMMVYLANGSQIKGFPARLAPGESACCHWEDTQCNPSGESDKKIKVIVKQDTTMFKRFCDNSEGTSDQPTSLEITIHGTVNIVNKTDSFACKRKKY